jgi:NAD(P)-dependent dehydrogenase (short-subunit alcohol dehydrogenase family)
VLITGGSKGIGFACATTFAAEGCREHGVRVLGVHPPSTRTERIVNIMKGS